MKHGGQGRALPAGGHVGRAEVADDRRAQALDQISRFSKLQSGRTAARRVMEDGLAVQAGQRRPWAADGFGRQGVAGVKPPQIVVRLRQLVAWQIPSRGGVERGPQGGRKAGGPERAQIEAARANAAERIIHPVNAGAGHDAENKALLHHGPLKIGN